MRAGSPTATHPPWRPDRGVHSDFATPSEGGAVEDRGTGGHEHLVLERRAGDVCARPDQAVVADRTGGAGPNDGVFHDDPVAPDPDGTTGLADEARAVQDTHARSNRDVAAGHPRRRVDRWTLPACSISIVSLSSRLAASVGQVAIQAAPAVVSYPRLSLWAIHA